VTESEIALTLLHGHSGYRVAWGVKKSYWLLVISVVALGIDNKKRPSATTLITNNQ